MCMKKNIQDFKDRKPFEVPEGYFEGLTDKIMESLPEAESAGVDIPKVGLWSKLKPLVYLAAMFVGAALLVRVFMPTTEPVIDEYTAQIAVEEVSDEYLNDAIDQTFVDDYEMHLYLTSNLE